jgi:transcriptional regulator GlxA family with amidase domain
VGGRTVTVAGGFAVGVQRPQGVYDLLIVPGLEISRLDEWDIKLAALARELAFIRKSFAAGTPVAAVCVGTFLLGEAGLLAGRKATTAWLCAADLASRYPAATLSADAVLVEDGAVITTGAVSSAFDLAIHLVKKTLGAEVATATARLALLSQPRASQAPFVDSTLLGQTSLPSFAQGVAQWLGARLTETYDLERLAQAFHVSTRTLLRRVKTQSGNSPLALLQQARVDKAKQLLSDSALSIAQITEAVGYADVPTFSRLFANHVGETPARYRRRLV